MCKLSVTKREQIQLQRINNCKERSELFANILKRKPLHELNELVTLELNNFDDELLDCILQCIDLLDRYDLKINDIIHEFNLNKIDYIQCKVTPDNINNLYQELLCKLNDIVHEESIETTMEELLCSMSKRVQLTSSHVHMLCVVSASKGVSKIYERKERYINCNLITKLYYWGDYLLSRLFDSTEYIANYIYNALTEQISCEVSKQSLTEFNSTVGERVNKERERYSKLYRSRELNKLARDYGYRKVRQRGDHGVFKREDGHIVIIPQGRSIGKGLSCKIQKHVLY